MKFRYIAVAVMVATAAWLGMTAVRHAMRESNDKSVCSYQIRTAVDQVFLESPEKQSVSYDDLIGADKPIRRVTPVDGEDYRELFPIPRNYRELALTMGDGRRVILFDRVTLRQNADGSFPVRYNPDLASVEHYRRWVLDGRPLPR